MSTNISKYYYKQLILLITLVLLNGCAYLDPNFEEPTVTVMAFKPIASQSVSPEFQIDLRIINPNKQALQLNGIAYTAYIEGYKVLTGVTNELPVVAAYGESDITLKASPDIFGGIGLLSDLLQRQRDSFSYRLSVKLDVGTFTPSIIVNKEGRISFAARSVW